MAAADHSPKLTCGTLALMGLLALLVVVALHRQAQPPAWGATGAAVLTVVCVFHLSRWVLGWFWGLVTAGLLTFHPLWHDLNSPRLDELFAGTAVLAVVTTAGYAWHLTLHPRFAWRVWLPVLAVQVVGTGLAWNVDPYLGLLALAVALVELGLAVVLGLRLRQVPEAAPSSLNVGTAVVGLLVLPAASLVVYRFFDRSLYANPGWWPLVRDAFPTSVSFASRAFTLEELEAWCWPHPWAVLPVLMLALLLTVRRGWKQWARCEPPSAWFLTVASVLLLTALCLFPVPGGAGLPLLLTAWSVLLTVFAASDLLRSFFDRLVLLPPEERVPAPGVAPK